MKYFFYKAPELFGAFLFTVIISVVLDTHLFAQVPQSAIHDSDSLYDTDLLPKEFYSGRREALRKLMEDSSVAVFFSAPIKNKSNDVDYEFHQDPSFYYFTGLKETDAVLLVFKNAIRLDSITGNEILFSKEKDPKTERWTGKVLGINQAKKILGIQSIYPTSSFDKFKINKLPVKTIYSLNLSNRCKNKQQEHFSHAISVNNIIYNNTSLKEMVATLRQVKMQEELVLMRKAINITCDGFREAMKALEPGMYEYDVEAIVEYMLRSEGAEDVGYPSIVGGGENSCILHYESNRKRLLAGDILVCDIGAEYHGYSADVTRTIPANGKYLPEQKAIYNIVLEAQLAGISKCKPGEDFRAPHKAAMEVIQKRLMELGIIKTPNEAIKYFFHGTSHYLGLDVHDAGDYGKLMPNNVITVEPGIYIPAGSECDKKWWNIGIRIEDDVLITGKDPDVLSSCIPKQIDEIEKIMQQSSPFSLLKLQKK